MDFMKVGTLAEIASRLETVDKLGSYAEKQLKIYEAEKIKIAELYPTNTVKPKPINYCHFRMELDELMLDVADAATVLNEIGIQNAELLGIAKPDADSYTYLVYKWKNYFLLFPLCQDFFFITEDRENRLKSITPIKEYPYFTAQIFAQKNIYSNTVIRAEAHYKTNETDLLMASIAFLDGPYLLSEKEDKEKVRNLIHYLRERYCYGTASEINHADLPNSVRLD